MVFALSIFYLLVFSWVKPAPRQPHCHIVGHYTTLPKKIPHYLSTHTQLVRHSAHYITTTRTLMLYPELPQGSLYSFPYRASQKSPTKRPGLIQKIITISPTPLFKPPLQTRNLFWTIIIINRCRSFIQKEILSITDANPIYWVATE